MDEDLIAALGALDSTNDEHWTSDGAPLMDAVNVLAPGAKRQDVRRVAPNYTRANRELGEPEVEPKAKDSAPVRPAAPVGLAEAEAAMQAADVARAVAEQAYKDACKQHDSLLRQAPEAYVSADRKHMENVQFYLRSQRASQERRDVRRRQVIDAGVTREDLESRSPIDRAMARKTGLDGGRPTS